MTIPVIVIVQSGDPDKPTVDFTKGLPASAKSTWTHAEWEKDPTIVVVNNDNLGRAMTRHRTPENGALLAAVRSTVLTAAINQGRRVIVDNTNLSPKSQREILAAAARDGRTVRCIDFTAVTAEECILRDALRTGNEKVGADVINGMVKSFLTPKPAVAHFTHRTGERLFLTSDLHFGHANILGYGRSETFPDLDAMNQGLIDRWNSVVNATDTVIVLGDAAMGKRAETLEFFGQMAGKKHLIAGNHDNCWEHGKNPSKWMDLYLEYFVTIDTEAILHTDQGDVRLHHFPYSGDHTKEDRYPHARPEDDGMPLLHGHVHDLWQRRESAKGTPQVNVGVDVHDFKPVLVSDLLSLLGL